MQMYTAQQSGSGHGITTQKRPQVLSSAAKTKATKHDRVINITGHIALTGYTMPLTTTLSLFWASITSGDSNSRSLNLIH